MSTFKPEYYEVAGIEVADIAGHLTFNAGNALKYLARSSRIDGITKATDIAGRVEDLCKARTCIDMEIARLKKTWGEEVTE